MAAADVMVVAGVETTRSSMTGAAKAGRVRARIPPTARNAAIVALVEMGESCRTSLALDTIEKPVYFIHDDLSGRILNIFELYDEEPSGCGLFAMLS